MIEETRIKHKNRGDLIRAPVFVRIAETYLLSGVTKNFKKSFR